MKKAKQTLTAALAATLATGVVGSVASAATNDDLYKAAYSAMVKAQTEKTQTAINEARVAINALPKELDWAKGEFSKQVDTVQQPIYTQIIALIEKGQKEAKQETVNEGKKLLVGVEEAYAKTWSSNFDTIQQTLVNNATEAVKAAKSQKPEDIKKAADLVAELKTADSADVKKAVEGLEKDFANNVNVYAVSAEAKNASSITITFSKEVEKDSIDKTDFAVTLKQQKVYVKEVSVADDKKSATLTLSSDLKDKEEYKLVVDGIKDTKGNKGNRTELTVKYEKQDLNAVEFKSTNVLRGADLKKDYIIVKDTAGRDVTKEAKVKFACVEDKNLVTSEGKVSGSATVNKEYTIRILDSNDKVIAEQTIKIVSKLDNAFIGYTLTLADVDDDAKYADIAPNSKIQLGNTAKLTIFYTDALGKEKKVDAKNAKVTLVDKGVVSIVGDNKIKALKEGHAVVKVVYGSMEQEIDIETTKDAVADLDLTVSDALLADVNLYAPIEIKNNNKLIGAEDEDIINTAKVQMYNSQGDSWYTVDSKRADGQLWLNGKNLKDGRAKLVLSSKYGSKEYEFDIKVQKPAKISSYLLEARKTGNETGSVDTIDLNNDGKSESATLHVYAIDENGLRISEVAADKVHVTKMNGNDVDKTKPDLINNVIDVNDVFGEEGSVLFDVEYNKINGGTDTAQITLTVKNSYDKAVSVRASQEEYTTTGAISLADVLEFYYGNTYTKAQVTDVVAYENNDKNQTKLSMTTPLEKRYYTIHVKSVKIAANGQVYTVDDNVDFTIK